MKLYHAHSIQNTRLFLTLFVFFVSLSNLLAQSVSLPTDRARVTIAEIADYYDPTGKKLKVLRTDSNTPLRGGTAWIWEKQGQEEPESYYKLMSSKGLNAVRMILFDTWEVETYTPSPGVFTPTDWNDAAYRTRQLTRMERAVNYASKYGMYFIINSHNHIPQYNEAYTSALWKYVAPYFANRTHVLYELANEPMSGIGKNGDMDMGAAGALKSPRLQALKRSYDIARAGAPNTMLMILTPPGINDAAYGTGMGNLADSFAQLPGTKVDWTKTAVAYHLYNNDAAWGAATKAKNLRNLHQRYAGWPSENSFPPGVNGLLNTDQWRSPSFDNDLYVNQTCEKLGIGWDLWFINGTKQFNANFPVMWADAVAKGWTWTKDVITPQSKITSRGENLPDEGIANISDGKANTNWLDKSITSWIQFEYETAQTWNTCIITTGSDAQNAANDPKSWNLKGSDDGTSWTTIDSQSSLAFPSRSIAYTYNFANSVAYKYYCLDISENNGGSNIELGELQFMFVDREAPTVPSDLSFSANFILTWKASTDNLGIVTYEIFNNGISVGKTLTNSFTVPGMKPKTEYNFTVKAGDPAENWSEFSSKLTTTTGIFTQFEAENALTSGGGLNTNHPGFSGTGFWDNVGTVGNYIEFTVNSISGGSTDITCRYSSGTENKTMTMYVNSVKYKVLTFPSTKGWDNWASSVENVNLNVGNNTIRYQYDNGNTGYINVDFIKIATGTTGIFEEKSNLNPIVFPNPASDQITIRNTPMNAIISVFRNDGKLMKQIRLESNESVIDVSTWSNGIYLLNIQNRIASTTVKFVVN
jgi:hypothetical protein